ncbi:MAG: hypothetical protein NkDv07_0901 [Candidatus Improbicoccus devescovinae]|nr:MAG: hypothetical protein NkDv07_0901 [Candidatus Improbicoccus devescovinae]
MKRFKFALAKILLVFAICCSIPQKKHIQAQESMNTTQKFQVDSESDLLFFSDKKDIKGINEIILTKDIEITHPVEVPSSVTLDLNGHTITYGNPNVQISIGKKTLLGKVVSKVIHHPGYVINKEENKNIIVTNGYQTNVIKQTTYKPKVVGAYNSVVYKDVYSYDDDTCVSIRNGTIKGAEAFSVGDKDDAYWISQAHGTNGETPCPMIVGISGVLKLENVNLIAGNGSNGGNATYSNVWHLPFIGGGNGGHGGNAGNGGSIISCDHTVVFVDKNTKFIPGLPGEPGRGSGPNPKYWVFKGSTGKDGKPGSCGYVINNHKKLIRI